MDPTTIQTAVKARYTATALAPPNPSHAQAVAQAFGYSAAELASIPADANLGVSCGNPLALAGLKEGETVIDLGCGAGFDCFLAAAKVGEKGTVVGVDVNEAMLHKARANALKHSIKNISFLLSPITQIPLPPSTATLIISNCVINLVPATEKPLVFREIHRLLQPGGRLAVSDILAKKDLPEQMKHDLALYVGCVAGASRKEEYEAWLAEAGFEEVVVVDAGVDLNVYTSGGEDGGCCGPAGERSGKDGEEESAGCCGTGAGAEKRDGGVLQDVKSNFKHVDLNEWAGSFKIFAVKPLQ